MNEGLPPELLAAYSLVGVFVGELIKKLHLQEWITPINMVIGGLLGVYFLNGTMSPLMAFFTGTTVGAGASGIYSIGRKVIKAEKKA